MEDYTIIPSLPSGGKNAEQNILNIGKMRENGAKFSANFPCKYGIICLLCQILVILDGWNSKKDGVKLSVAERGIAHPARTASVLRNPYTEQGILHGKQ
jgi:hypothetical protein